MTSTDPLTLIRSLYHFTDPRNLSSIRQQKGIWPLAVLRREGVAVPAPGGNQWSHEADRRGGLDAYVHLCFRNRHPMEYLAKQEGRIIDSVFLEISGEVLKISGVLFTSEVSNKSGGVRHTLEQARTMIDFQVLYTHTDWNDPAIQQRLRSAERCEILVPGGVPLSMIRNLPDG